MTLAGDNYTEAIDCLQRRHDRPRLIHCEHVRAILDVVFLKDSYSTEIRRLYDVTNQHLRGLKVLDMSHPGCSSPQLLS